MSPRSDGGGAGRNPNAPAKITAATKRHDPDQSTATADLPTVLGTELSPIGRARLPRVLVECNDCGHRHLHVKFELDARSIVRSPACRPHAHYRVVITSVVPARRQEGAA